MFAFGNIVLVRFPFTDLSGAKQRPGLVVSTDNELRIDLVLCFITSRPLKGPDMSEVPAVAGTGLKAMSNVRFDKIATLHRSVISGLLGNAPPDWLIAQRRRFYGVFGFGPD